jgi:predicted small secreted protein
VTVKKNLILLLLLFLAPIFLSGCETAKGVGAMARGAGEGIGATAGGVAKDTSSLWQGILKADNWIKKNLW